MVSGLPTNPGVYWACEGERDPKITELRYQVDLDGNRQAFIYVLGCAEPCHVSEWPRGWAFVGPLEKPKP